MPSKKFIFMKEIQFRKKDVKFRGHFRTLLNPISTKFWATILLKFKISASLCLLLNLSKSFLKNKVMLLCIRIYIIDEEISH